MSSHRQVSIGTGHGGCGSIHDRPAGPDGQPVKLWALTCAGGCEDFLRGEPGWSSTISEIAETYDEKLARDDFQKRGAMDRDQVLAMALAKLAGVELPETLRSRITGGMPDAPAMTACPDGHQNRAGAKFCAECGSVVPEEQASGTVTCPDGHENPAASKFCGECGTGMREALPAVPESVPINLDAMTASELRAHAKRFGIDASGTKAEVLGRLQAAQAA
jgi:hypothetical protein